MKVKNVFAELTKVAIIIFYAKMGEKMQLFCMQTSLILLSCPLPFRQKQTKELMKLSADSKVVFAAFLDASASL